MADEEDQSDKQLFREIDEDLRRERYMKLWKDYGRFVVGAAVTVVLATAGWVWWQRHQLSVRGEEGERYAAAAALVGKGNTAAAIKAFAQVAAESGAGYAALAKLREAALLANKGDLKGAAALYDAIAADADANQNLRHLARLLGTLSLLDTGDPGKLTAKLAPLAKVDGPWHYAALELTGLLAERAGDIKRARAIYTRLVDDAAAPASLRARARVYLELLGNS
ncbi:MAG: tetratricopeptide repeat protein [Alphaproteobacteria bacterium]|nr:tetratricopeptide repeat protein [Alphaproteobacteria bacterium]